MIMLELDDNQSGYNMVAEYVRRYWEHNMHDAVIVSLGISHDGNKYSLAKEVALPVGLDGVEFLYDWWEGEKYIKLFGIRSISELDVSGGLYEQSKN